MLQYISEVLGTAPEQPQEPVHPSSLSLTSKSIDANALTTLLHTHIVGRFPTSRYHAYMCSAGSQGYNAVKEMLQSGASGNVFLLERGDLAATSWMYTPCRVYTIQPPSEHWATGKALFHPPIPNDVPHLTIYSNLGTLPEFRWMLRGGSTISAPPQLKTIDLSPLSTSHVTVIEDSFLADCVGLATLDLTSLSEVTRVGNFFLQGCAGLKDIDLGPLSEVEKIGTGFMKGCTGLTTITMPSPVWKVSEMGWCFMCECTSLTTIDLGSLTQLKAINAVFLEGCTGLTSIDLAPLYQVTSLSTDFLSNCTSLSTIDMRPLIHLQFLPHDVVDNHRGKGRRTLLLPAHLLPPGEE